jgi:predicted phage terminase large subunit-like protein
VAALARIRANVLDYDFEALFQQTPQKKEGSLIKARQILQIRLHELPDDLVMVRYWDLAVSSAKRADWLAGALLGFSGQNLYIIHVARFPGPWTEAREKIVEQMLRDPAAVTQGIEVAGQQGGYLQELQREQKLLGRAITGVNPGVVGNKRVRAEVWGSRIPGKMVHLVVGNGWDVEAFIAECVAFPLGAHDDQVDAVSGAVQMLGVESLAEMTSEDPGEDFGGYGGVEA